MTSKSYGVDLATLLKTQAANGVKSNVPEVVTKITGWLDVNRGILKPSLFAALGNEEKITEIKKLLDAGGDLSKISKANANEVAIALKAFLLELPEPVFTTKMYSSFVRAAQVADPLQRVLQLRLLVYLLPAPNRDLVLSLVQFFASTATVQGQGQGSTAQGQEALASTLAPYMLRPSAEAVVITDHTAAVALVLKKLIEESAFVLKALPKPTAAPAGAPDLSVLLTARSLYVYQGNNKFLLDLQKNDVVTVVDVKSEDGWLRGTLNGKTGYFPTTYVEVQPVPESSKDLKRTALPTFYLPPEQAKVSRSTSILGMSPVPSPTNPRLKQSLSVSQGMTLPRPPAMELPPAMDLPPPPGKNAPTAAKNAPLPAMNLPPPPSVDTLPAGVDGMSLSMADLPPPPPLPPPPMDGGFFPSGDMPPPPPLDLPLPPPPQMAFLSPQLHGAVASPGLSRISPDLYSSLPDDAARGSASPENARVDPNAPAAPPPPIGLLQTTPRCAEQDPVNAHKRKERAEEVMATERTYVKQLGLVFEHFVDPIRKRDKEKNPLISLNLCTDIISNIEVILNCHKKLVTALNDRVAKWDEVPELGDIFLENTGFIKLYKYYVNNFDKSIIALKQAKENHPEFKKFMEGIDYTERFNGLNLEAYLILPVQRIPRYVLLLQDLLKFTATSHSDFNNLSNALSFIKDLAEYINSNKSDADSINKIMSVQDTITDLPSTLQLAGHKRTFIDEGPLIMNKKKYHIILFNDMLLYTKPEKKSKKFKGMINLQTASLNTTDEPGVLKVNSSEGTFRFTSDIPKDRDHWAKRLKEAMDSSRQDMINSAFGANVQAEGHKGFHKKQDEDNANKRHQVAEQVVKSEEEYVHQLTYVRNTFLAPLRKSVDSGSPMLSLADVIDITSNFETLLSCHISFLESLQERLAGWAEKPQLSDLFLEKTGFLKLYSYYVTNHDKSLVTIDHCMEKSSLFAIFLRNLEAREKVDFKLLMTEPMRRISNYYLLMNELLQYTRPKQDDHEQLSKVVSSLKDQTDKLSEDLHKSTDKKMGTLRGTRTTTSSRSKFRLSSSKNSN